MTTQSMIEDSLLPAPTPEIVAAPPLNGSPRERTPPARASEPSFRPLVSQLRRVYRRLSRASVSRPPPREVPTLSSLAQAVNPPDVVVPPSTNAAGTQEGAGIPFGPPRVPEPGTVPRSLPSGVDQNNNLTPPPQSQLSPEERLTFSSRFARRLAATNASSPHLTVRAMVHDIESRSPGASAAAAEAAAAGEPDVPIDGSAETAEVGISHRQLRSAVSVLTIICCIKIVLN